MELSQETKQMLTRFKDKCDKAPDGQIGDGKGGMMRNPEYDKYWAPVNSCEHSQRAAPLQIHREAT